MPYAWAPIHTASNHEDGKHVVHKRIQAGDEVSKSDFTDEDWDTFVKERIIRKEKFPKGVKLGESVRTALIRQANEARDTALANAATIEEPDNSDTADTTEKKPWQ